MRVFKYQALDSNGLVVEGLVRAPSKYEAEEKIKSRKLEVMNVKTSHNFMSKFLKNISFSGISAWDKSTVYRELATMIKAGIPLVRALQSISKTSNNNIQKLFAKVIADLNQGKSFSAACQIQKKFFSEVDVHIIESGEATGSFDRVLLKLADEKEKEYSLRQKVKGAMIYPIIVFVVIIGVVIIMITKIMPVLSEIFTTAGKKPPMATQVLIGLSEFFINYWWLIIILLAVFTTVLTLWTRYTLIGKYILSLVKFKAPVFGKLHQSVSLAEITSTLSILLSSGVDIISAVKLASGVTTNQIYRRCFKNIADNLEKGIPISATMEAYERVFPPIVGNMISVGEESGTMDQMLLTLAHYYEEDADTKVKTLSSSLEPLIIVFLGFGVAFIVFAVMMPIYNLTDIY